MQRLAILFAAILSGATLLAEETPPVTSPQPETKSEPAAEPEKPSTPPPAFLYQKGETLQAETSSEIQLTRRIGDAKKTPETLHLKIALSLEMQIQETLPDQGTATATFRVTGLKLQMDNGGVQSVKVEDDLLTVLKDGKPEANSRDNPENPEIRVLKEQFGYYRQQGKVRLSSTGQATFLEGGEFARGLLQSDFAGTGLFFFAFPKNERDFSANGDFKLPLTLSRLGQVELEQDLQSELPVFFTVKSREQAASGQILHYAIDGKVLLKGQKAVGVQDNAPVDLDTSLIDRTVEGTAEFNQTTGKLLSVSVQGTSKLRGTAQVQGVAKKVEIDGTFKQETSIKTIAP